MPTSDIPDYIVISTVVNTLKVLLRLRRRKKTKTTNVFSLFLFVCSLHTECTCAKKNSIDTYCLLAEAHTFNTPLKRWKWFVYICVLFISPALSLKLQFPLFWCWVLGVRHSRFLCLYLHGMQIGFVLFSGKMQWTTTETKVQQ